MPNPDRKMVLEAVQRTPDGAGGFTEVWTALGEHWVELAPRTGREAGGEALTLSSVPYRIALRAAPFGAPSRPVPGQRFRHGAQILAIHAVAEMAGDPRWLVCIAREEVST